jgi:selenide,water dikinase
VGAHAATDVTGFGLLGHLHGLALQSGLAAVVDAGTVPYLEGVPPLLADDLAVSGGSRRNRTYAETFTAFDADVEEWQRRLVTDATTSGGLLLAVPHDAAAAIAGAAVGRLIAGEPGKIAVR